jgi:PAS domain-containing protein
VRRLIDLMSSDQERVEDAILNAINAGLIVLDRDERVTHWNAWMEAASGYSRSYAQGKFLTDIFSGVDLRRLTPAIKAAQTSGASTIVTHAINPSLLPLQTRSKTPLLHDITVTPVGAAPDAGCLVSITDVTMAIRRERYLRDRQNARYDAVVANAADVIVTVDQDGLIQFANPAALSQFGYSNAELLGQ